MTTWITICDTCKREGWEETGTEVTDGEALAALVEAALAQSAGAAKVKTRRISCLMGCKQACNVALQAHGKLAYTLGAFAPTQEAAEGIVAYALAHAQSATGQVPYRQWPAAVKGHFITRHPPLDADR
ncbi:MAG TPA: DUF1636 domain-containing protein [Rhodobacteraceae bacterium]|nr:DUF1636 domain-containing protein [Paracoccaceae bacterium]